MVVGAGGVGGYLAGKLSQDSNDVFVVARGAHLAAIQQNGLTIKDGEDCFTVSPAASDKPEGIYDAIFICTKGYGLQAAAEQIRSCVGEHTLVIPLLNGVNIHKRLAEVLPTGQILSGSIYIYANIASPGVIQKNGPMVRVVVGAPNKTAAAAPEALHTLCAIMNKSGIPTEIADDILRENWVKWAILVSNGQSNAYFDAPLGAIREDPQRMEFVLSLLREVVAVGRAEGIALPDNLEETLLNTMRVLPYESVSSLTRDIRTPGKPTELSLFSGEVCRLADIHGISVPANRSMLLRFQDRL